MPPRLAQLPRRGMRPRGLDVGETWVYRTRLEEVVGSPCNCVLVVFLDGKPERTYALRPWARLLWGMGRIAS